MDELATDGVVVIEDGYIADVRPAAGADRHRQRRGWIVPGFVDMHVHGGGGYTFTTGSAEQARAAAHFHARHGTTTMLASLVSTDHDTMVRATLAYQPLIAEGVLAGLHYEGPYLSAVRCGAQNPDRLRVPDLTELHGLLDLGGVRMVTLAPELPDALTAIGGLAGRGVLAAVGHTDATYEQTMAAVAAGASVATHLCNGMRPVHHREPGPVLALLDAPGVVCELIPDGVHLHEGMLRHAVRVVGPDRVALITDAISAAGTADGWYELGGQEVSVAGGVARLTRDGAVAGSTLTMDEALRRTVHSGVSLADAVRMAGATPARAIGLGDTAGVIAVGRRADLVVLDDELAVREVVRGGVPIR